MKAIPTEISASTTPLVPAIMTSAEARKCINKIKNNVDSVRQLLSDLHAREGWKALGYASMQECAEAEFGQNKSTLYRQLRAAIIESEIVPGEPIGSIPQRPLNALETVPEEERKEVWDAAVEKAAEQGKAVPTETIVKEVIDAKRESHSRVRESNPKGNGKKEKPVNPNTVDANGEPMVEPKDVAKLRKSGKISADTKVTVTEVNGGSDAEGEAREPGDDLFLDDAEWATRLPLWNQLAEHLREDFERDAIHWRHMHDENESIVGTVRAQLKRDKKSANEKTLPPYMYRTRVYAMTPSPEFWRLCLTTQMGGCEGKGRTRMGPCTKCFGYGYTILDMQKKKGDK